MSTDDQNESSLFFDEESEPEDGMLDVDPLTALRLRHDLDRLYRDTADMANDRPKRTRGPKRKERVGVTYTTTRVREPDWQKDRALLPKKPPTNKG
jgi:hypothetical protein